MTTSRFVKMILLLAVTMSYGASAVSGIFGPWGFVFGPALGWAFYTFVNGEARWTQ